MEQKYERNYQAFKRAYEFCLVYDKDFDTRFFHVLMENPVQPFISEAMRKVSDSSLPLEPTYRKFLVDFVNRLEELGPTEEHRVEAIQRAYDEIEVFNPELILEIAQQHATHDKNGFWLSENDKISQLVDEGANLLTRAHQLKTAEQTSSHFNCCPKSYFIAVERTLSRADSTTKNLKVLSDLTLKYMQTNAAYFECNSFSMAQFCQKVCSVCHGLSHVRNRPDVIRQILTTALQRQEERARQQKAAMKLRDSRAKQMPPFVSDFLYDLLATMSSDRFSELQSIFLMRNINYAEDLQRLYRQVQILQSYFSQESVDRYIDQQRAGHTQKTKNDHEFER